MSREGMMQEPTRRSDARDARSGGAAWSASGASTRGASHVRDGSPNQDAIASWVDKRTRRTAIVSIADGHGSPRHFRSALGARFAVEASLEVLRDHAARFDTGDDAARAQMASVDVPLRIVELWNERTRTHLDDHPFEESELQSVEATEGTAAANEVRADPLLAYGATVLAAMVCERCIVLTQLGDGDILAVAFDGTTTRPLPGDERLSGNLTTSICRAGAESDFRSVVLARDPEHAALLLSTDGYANSFRSDADFLQVGHDFVAMIEKDGIAKVEGQLEAILQDASTHGSGDDITLGILQCIDAGGSGVALPVEASGDRVQRRAPSDGPMARVRAGEDAPVAERLAQAEQHASRLRMMVIAISIVAVLALGYAFRDRLRAWTAQGPDGGTGRKGDVIHPGVSGADAIGTPGVGKGDRGVPVIDAPTGDVPPVKPGKGKPETLVPDESKPGFHPPVKPGGLGAPQRTTADGGIAAPTFPQIAAVTGRWLADGVRLEAKVDYTNTEAAGCRIGATLLDAKNQPVGELKDELLHEPATGEPRLINATLTFSFPKDAARRKAIKEAATHFSTALYCGSDRIPGIEQPLP